MGGGKPDRESAISNEAVIRQFFGPAAHLLTVPLARRLAPHLPLTFHGLHGQSWWDVRNYRVIHRLDHVDTITLTRVWFDGEVEVEAYSSKHLLRLTEPINALRALGSGSSGTHPVYLFLAARAPGDPPPDRVRAAAVRGGVRPMALNAIAEQLPVRPPDAIDPAEGDDATARRFFGAAAELLTVAVARRLAPRLPLHLFCADPSNLWFDPSNPHRRRLRSIYRLLVLRWDEAARVLHVGRTENIERWRLSIRRSPVYVFLH